MNPQNVHPTMAEYSPLHSALPDHLQTFLASTQQTHTLRTWEVNEEEETHEVVYRLVFGKKKEGEDVGDLKESGHTSSSKPEVEEATRQHSNDSGKDPLYKTPVTMPLACVADYEDYCRRTMSSRPWLYFSGGAMTGATVQRNKDAFKKILLNPKQLVDVSHPDLCYTIRATGETVPLPIGIAPTAYHPWATPEGEYATMRAARETEVVYVSSAHAAIKLENIADTEPQPIRWQQQKLDQDFMFTEEVVRRAEKAGVTAIVLSIDKPVNGLSWDMMRGLTNYPHHLMIDINTDPKFEEKASIFNTKASWDDVKWFCELTSLPVILKGVMTPESARMAVQVGAKGVIVSNHGGRTLDGLPATIDVLRDVVEAVGDKIEVFLDGGITTGLDVFKALAYGAKMVFIGRSAIWAWAACGQAGLCHVINILKEELLNIMQHMGTPTLNDITMDSISKSKINKWAIDIKVPKAITRNHCLKLF